MNVIFSVCTVSFICFFIGCKAPVIASSDHRLILHYEKKLQAITKINNRILDLLHIFYNVANQEVDIHYIHEEINRILTQAKKLNIEDLINIHDLHRLQSHLASLEQVARLVDKRTS